MGRFDGGWVKLHRKINHSDIVHNPNCFLVWSWLLMNANYEESKAMFCGGQVVVKPGMILFGIKEIADHWKISRSTVHKWLHYLELSERISIEVRTHGCLATILNWETYQGSDDDDRTTCKHDANAMRDAQQLRDALDEKLKGPGRFLDVVSVGLQPDLETKRDENKLEEIPVDAVNSRR